MCGICGIIRRVDGNGAYSEQTKKMNEWFTGLLVESQARGEHSTGVIISNRARSSKMGGVYSQAPVENAKVYMHKEAVKAEDFVKSKKYKDIQDKSSKFTTSWIGHTRNASQATPEMNQNNHPHRCGRVLGVHNGFISNWLDLVQKYKFELNSFCDSEVMFRLIDMYLQDGYLMKGAIKKAVKEIKGVFACAVIDLKNNSSVTVFRRDKPIKFRIREIGGAIAFASEAKFITSSYLDKISMANDSPSYIDCTETVLPNNHAFTFNTDDNSTVSNGYHNKRWVKNLRPFSLD